MSRRSRVSPGLVSLFLLGGLGCAGNDQPAAPRVAAPPPPTPYLQAALGAARFVDAHAREVPTGLSWLPPVEDWPVAEHGMYNGGCGVVRFWLEAWRHTGDPIHLEKARRGGDHILAAVPESKGVSALYSLYSGWGGPLWTLEQLHAATGDPRYREGALRLLEQIHAAAQDAGTVDGRDAGVHWSTFGETTDVFGGTAGIGLLLLWAADAFDHPPSRALAARAGRWLLGASVERTGGLTWPIDKGGPRVMPNFSHGTAGVAYFLATLYQATGEKDFLDAALAGAQHLVTIAEKGDGQVCLVFHEEKVGEDRHYLGFCHGPVGTTRLFERLYLVTRDLQWRAWVDRGTRGILESGIPEQRTAGFWNNVSQCCGSAGVIEHVLHQYRRTRDPKLLAFARHMGDDLLARATEQSGGLAWVQAEHRVKPELLEAQVGYMQGAAGIGITLLHLDAAVRGLEVQRLVFVDDPW
ncbi:MAG TPA: lanthionine synthetase LanC family protein [Thermoanaerobaculia bacterium]|nr:lanthionine synthetase LanC family protein [Thermoanaerobaculia bacterium]